jgi:hypothetical protein
MGFFGNRKDLQGGKMSGLKFMRYVLLAAASAFCQAYGPAWTKSGVITIGTTADWANYTGGSVANFPALVKLDSSVFKFSEAKAGGADIGFTDAAGAAKLSFEIESWDAAAGKAAIWVKVPTVAANAKATIKMFWGNPAATAESNGAGVFGDQLGVWHLSDGATATVNKDASGHGADGTLGHGDDKTVTADATVASVVASPMGTGLAYNRNLDNLGFTRVDSAKIHLNDKSITISGWMQRDSINHPGDYFVAQGTQDPHLGVRIGFDYRNRASWGIDGGIETSAKDLYTASTQEVDWHYWVGTFNVADKKAVLYKDGVQAAAGTFDFNYTGRGFLDMGFAYGPSGEYFHPTGGLDEVRVGALVSSPDFIKLSYLNQNAHQSLVGYPVPTGCTQSFSASGPSAPVTEGATVSLAGTAKCAERFGWFKVEGTTETPVESKGTRLEFATRVTGTTVSKYRFKAMFAGAWQQKDVDVTINEAIPEPAFAFKGTLGEENGSTIAKVYPEFTNLAAIKASASPNLNYRWELSGTDMVENTDYLRLDHNGAKDTSDVYFLKDGKLTAKLCIDNGGPAVCHQIEISNTAISIRPQMALDSRSFELKGSQLTWKVDAIIMVWDLKGKLMFSRSGSKGDQAQLSPDEAELVHSKNHFFKVIPRSKNAKRISK